MRYEETLHLTNLRFGKMGNNNKQACNQRRHSPARPQYACALPSPAVDNRHPPARE